jgi:integrase/recombinase XerD
MPIRPSIGTYPDMGQATHVATHVQDIGSSSLPPIASKATIETLLDVIIRRGDSIHTRRAYAGDLRLYARWLAEKGLAWDVVVGDDLDRYREWLSISYATSTSNRRLTVVRLLYAEAERRGIMSDNPGGHLRSVRGRDEREGGALTRCQVQDVLERTARDLACPSLRLIALRDLAMLSVLVRTGLRRFEVVGLQVGDLGTSGGHNVATVRAGKGNVTRTVKLPPDVRRTIDAWLGGAAEGGVELEADDPIFVEVRRGGHVRSRRPLSDRTVHAIVTRRLRSAGMEALGPHALRATFVTLALEGGAPLHIVQRAAGHADPRTTERYWRRKDVLDNNAVDYVRL